MLSELLLFDIETVPQAPSFDELDAESQFLFRQKLAKTMPEELSDEEKYGKKAGILAEFGKIICISLAIFEVGADGSRALRMQTLSGHDEVEILRSFTVFCDSIHRRIPNFQFAGHNVREFDIPYICRRLLINRLSLPVYLQLHDKKPWEVRMFDTLSWWKFGDYKNYVSLHLLASVLGIPSSKSDIDGSQVREVYYVQNDLPRIAAYCRRDVVVTANIILRFLGHPMLDDCNILVV